MPSRRRRIAISPLKHLILACLTVMAGSFFVSSSDPFLSGFLSFARVVFWLTFAIHAIECAVFLPRLQRAPGATSGHVFHTLLFGGVHVRETPKRPA